MNKREKGKIAEEFACNYLVKNGFKILQTNFHFSKKAEVDIVASKNETLVFIEVRSRFHKNSYDPIWSITPSKYRKFKLGCEGYLYVNNIDGMICRMDVLIIDFAINPVRIEHIQNAF